MLDVFYAMEETHLEAFVNFKSDLDKLKSMATPAQIDQVKSAVQELQLSTGQSFTLDEQSGVATIPVFGTLTPRPEVCVSLTDGSQTIYSTITESIKMCEEMPSVKEITLLFGTPGGYVSGVDQVALAIKTCSKKTTGIVGDMACSAGFWLASQCDSIGAQTKLSQVGSIGVLVEVVDRSKLDADNGIKRHVLTSKNAPEKFQDISTKDGRNKIVERLTDIEKVFISRVAEGRNVSEDEVKENFGKGGVLLAEDALKAGMIDFIQEEIGTKTQGKTNKVAENKQDIKLDVPVNNNKPPKEDIKMSNLNELLAENSGANAEYKLLIAAAEKAGHKAGEKKINDRIDASKNFLSNEKYPTMGPVALKVLSGEIDHSAITIAVAAIDAQTQATASDDAADETKKQGDTPPENVKKINDSGVCETNEDFEAELARSKEQNGVK